jgi:hypothetical protein
MPIPSIDPAAQDNPALNDDEVKFNQALVNAGGDDGGDVDLTSMIVQGAVSVGGPMIMMPLANNILNEVMSDDD